MSGRVLVHNTSYRDQLDRAKRFYHRMLASSDGVELQDYAWAFFQNCWHVKEWIDHDPDVPDELAEKLKSMAHNSHLLQICQDLCNGTKHLEIDPPRSGQGAGFGHVAYTMHATLPDEPEKPNEMDFVVDDGYGKQQSTRVLADQCLAEWERILQANGVQAAVRS